MATPLLPDELWDEIARLLPPPRPRPKGGRRPIENRAARTGNLFVLRSGLPWEMRPAEMGCGSGMGCRRRLQDWQAAGVWSRPHHVVLDRLHAAGEIDWSRACLDSASVPAKKGACTGPNPTDRGKPGQSRHLVTDARGTPLMVSLSNPRLLPERGRPARHRHDGGDPRCHPVCAERSARTTATPSGQAAR